MEEVKRVLLLMTANTYRASDFLEAAERLGVRVTVGTDRPNVLENVVPGNALTLDFQAPKRAAGAIQAFAEAYPIEAVVAVDDDTVPLAAAASKALGLKSNPVEAAFAVRSKYQTRQILEEDGLPSPGFRLLSVEDSPEALARTVPYPAFSSPPSSRRAGGSSGRTIQKRSPRPSGASRPSWASPRRPRGGGTRPG